MRHYGRNEFSYFERRLEGLTPITEEMQSVNSNQESIMPKRGPGVLRHMQSFPLSRAGPTIIAWEPDDPENPYNWPTHKKMYTLVISSAMVVNSTMGSSLPSMAASDMMQQFGITSNKQKVLLVSIYLIGYVLGSLVWGPLSEHWGRRYLNLFTFIVFSLFTMACALAPTWSSLLVLRLFCGVFGSGSIAISSGIVIDLYSDSRSRAMALVVVISTTIIGPIVSPIVSGYIAPALGWRWTFWIGLIVAGVTFIPALFVPETFGPVLLCRRAELMRRQGQSIDILAPRDLEDVGVSKLVALMLITSLRMITFEPIIMSVCVCIAFVYGNLYMLFQAFPIILQDPYGLSSGVTGLSFLPIGVGVLLSLPIFWAWDVILHRAAARGAEWMKQEEYRHLPLTCIGGLLFVASLFWLGWSARQSVSFVVPMLAGIPFGMGYMMISTSLLTYLADVYDIFTDSAITAAFTWRSIFAVALPFATPSMLAHLGISGACSLIGGLGACMCFIPLMLIRKGPSSRARSTFCMILKERREEILQREEEERQERVFAYLDEKTEVINVK